MRSQVQQRRSTTKPVQGDTINDPSSSEPGEMMVDPRLPPRTNLFRKTEPDLQPSAFLA
jgi:hypothetical protein